MITVRMNQWVERNLFWVIPLALVGGLFAFRGLSSWISLVPWLFAWITFAMALSCKASDIWEAFRKPKLMIGLFVVGHGLLALIGWLWGALLLGADSPFRTGLVLLAAIPFGISSIIWVDQAKGNRAFTLAIVVIDTVLSPITVPVVLSMLVHQQVEVPVWKLMNDLFVMLVVPTLIGVLMNEFTRGVAVQLTKKWIGLSTKVCFIFVVMINAAAVAPQIWPFRAVIPMLIPTLVSYIFIGYMSGWWIGKGESSFWRRSALFVGGMRNISLGLVVALPYFGPTVAFPVIVTILLQQPMATLMHRWVMRKEPFTI